MQATFFPGRVSEPPNVSYALLQLPEFVSLSKFVAIAQISIDQIDYDLQKFISYSSRVCEVQDQDLCRFYVY